MNIKHLVVTRLMICWNTQQLLSDIASYPDTRRAQERLNSRIKVLNNFYIPAMNSQTNDQFENIFLIDRLHKDLDYSSFDFHKLNKCKILCLDSHRGAESADGGAYLKEFYAQNPLVGKEKDHGFKTIELSNGIKKNIEILCASSTNSDWEPGVSLELQSYLSQRSNDVDFFVTTRIDTDDAIQKNHIQNIQDVVYDKKTTMFIDHRKVLSAQIRNYSPPQIKTFKEFSYHGRTATMMLSTVFRPHEFEKYNCYRTGHNQIRRKFKTGHKIDTLGGLYLHWRGNMTKAIRLGCHTRLENTPEVKNLFPFLHDYDGVSNEHNFR